jgi:1-phosphatidylinositol-4-phosphate 5-kinase
LLFLFFTIPSIGLGLMDYSLLIGVVRRKYGVVDKTTVDAVYADSLGQDKQGAFHASTVEGPGSYYMGLIDILQEWNFEKKVERYFKIYFKFAEPEGLSAIDPKTYQSRFMERAVYEVFEGDDFEGSGDERIDETMSLKGPSTASAKKKVDRRFSVAPLQSSSASASPSVIDSVQSPMMDMREDDDSDLNDNGGKKNGPKIRLPSVNNNL